MMMIRPQPQQQAGLLLRSLGAGGGARPPGAIKSATSLLLGAALATAFFLLYTSLCRDLGAAAPSSGSPTRWEQETGSTAAAGVDRREVRGRLVEPKQQQGAAKGEEGSKHAAASSGDGDDGGATTEEKSQSKKKQQWIVMPATSSTQKVSFVFLTLSLPFDLFNKNQQLVVH